jgi:cysteine-rich repeat protein
LVIKLTDSLGQSATSSERVIALTQRPNSLVFDAGGSAGVNPLFAQVGVGNATFRVRVLDSAARPVPSQSVTFSSQMGSAAASTLGSAVSDSSGYASIAFSLQRAAGSYSIVAKLTATPEITTAQAFELQPSAVDRVLVAFIQPVYAGETASVAISAVDAGNNLATASNEELFSLELRNTSFHFGFADNLDISQLVDSGCACVVGERAKVRSVAGLATVQVQTAAVAGGSLPLTIVPRQVGPLSTYYKQVEFNSSPPQLVTELPLTIQNPAVSARLSFVANRDAVPGQPNLLRTGDTAIVRLEILDAFGGRVTKQRWGAGWDSFIATAQVAASGSAQTSTSVSLSSGVGDFNVVDQVAEHTTVSVSSVTPTPAGFDRSTTLGLDFTNSAIVANSVSFGVAHQSLHVPINLGYSEPIQTEDPTTALSVKYHGQTIPGVVSLSANQYTVTFTPAVDTEMGGCYDVDTSNSSLKSVAGSHSVTAQTVQVCAPQIGLEPEANRYVVLGPPRSLPVRGFIPSNSNVRISWGPLDSRTTFYSSFNRAYNLYPPDFPASIVDNGLEVTLTLLASDGFRSYPVANTLGVFLLSTDGDYDGDGLVNSFEQIAGLNPGLTDSDGDGISDMDEDLDGDNLTNRQERLLGTSMTNRDSDGDNIFDGVEDTDNDGVSNEVEFATGSDPLNAQDANLAPLVTALTVTPASVDLPYRASAPPTVQLQTMADVRFGSAFWEVVNVTRESFGTSYSSSDPAVVEHVADGLFRATGPGAAVIHATLNGIDSNTSVSFYTCGNGDLDAGEQCDDGNRAGSDGCSAQCRREKSVRATIDGADFGSCGLLNGSIRCWGSVFTSWPTASYQHLTMTSNGSGCVLSAAGAVTCWGSSYPNKPAGTFSDVSIGQKQIYAIKADGSLAAWGTAPFPTLPDGPFTQVVVTNKSTDHAACALRDDDAGTVVCFGRALTVPEGGYTALAAGGNHFCGLHPNGTVACWGTDTDGQTLAPADDHFVKITAGFAHSCGIHADGSARCWGAGAPGSSGGNNLGQSAVPTGPLDFFSEIAAGTWHTCARRRSGGVTCWGNNGNQQSTVPRNCQNGTLEIGESCDDHNNVAGDGCSIDCSSTEACGNGFVDASKGEVCDDYDGVPTDFCSADCKQSTRCSLAPGQTVADLCPAAECLVSSCDAQKGCVLAAGPDGGSCGGAAAGTCRSGGCVVPQVEVYGSTICSLNPLGNVTCWGFDGSEGIVSGVPATKVFTKISHAYSYACGIEAMTNQLTCWGSVTTNNNPVATPTAAVSDVALSESTACYIDKATETLKCWRPTTPPPPPGQYTQLAAASAGNAFCARRKTDGTLACWGGSTSYTPAGAFRSVDGGLYQFCGVHPDGLAECWQVYGGTSLLPPNDDHFVSVTVGYDSACGLRANGTTRCWGNVPPANAVPTGIADVFSSLATSTGGTCGVRTHGGVVCWGSSLAMPPAGTCGDGKLAPAEACDDHNTSDGDGCSSNCQSTEVCGNGIKDASKGEVCDDHGGANASFCSSDCQQSSLCSLLPGQTMADKCPSNPTCSTPSCDPQDGCSFAPINNGQACGSPGGVCQSGKCIEPELTGGGLLFCQTDVQQGSVICWNDTNDPYAVDPYSKVSLGQHSCGLRLGDDVPICWDSHDPGGQVLSGGTPSLDVDSAKLDGAVCAVRKDNGGIYCFADWTYQGNLPTPPDGQFTDVAVASIAYYHAVCGIQASDQTLVCNTEWESPYYAQPAPRGVALKQLVSGGRHFCGLTLDGSPVCWGDYSRGATLPPPGEHFKQLSAGDFHTCGLRDNGSVICWGAGSMSDGYPYWSSEVSEAHHGRSMAPTDDANLFSMIASSSAGNCGFRISGGIECWGYAHRPFEDGSRCGNGTRDLGEACDDGNRVSSDGCSEDCRSAETCGNGIIDTAKGEVCDDHANAVKDDCSSDCRTALPCTPQPGHTLSELCDDHNACTVDSCDAVQGCKHDGATLNGTACLDGTGTCDAGACMRTGMFLTNGPCELAIDGSASCITTYPPRMPLTELNPMSVVRSNGTYDCGLIKGYGWVNCQYTSDEITPSTGHGRPSFDAIYVATPPDVASDLSINDYGGCIIRQSDGALRCWGSPESNLLNPPSGAFTQLAVGYYGGCALRASDRGVTCWGDLSGAPVPRGTFKSLVAGVYDFCGLHDDGSAECWGYAPSGIEQVADERFVQLAASYARTCGRKADGQVLCWGDSVKPPQGPDALFVDITANNYTTCGRTVDDRVLCWGGQLSGGSCGDNVFETTVEACEDGNAVSADGCDATCRSLEVCGNGFVDYDEVCDAPPNSIYDTCSPDCQTSYNSFYPTPDVYLSFDDVGRLPSAYINYGRAPSADATIVGQIPAGETGLIGQTAKFDGGSDFITLGDAPTQSSSVTVAAWVRQTGVSGGARSQIAFYRSDPGELLGWSFESVPNEPGLSFAAGNALDPNFPASQVQTSSFQWNRWTHLAASFSAATSTLSLFIDGELVATTDATALGGSLGFAPDSALRIGGGFQGEIDEFGKWDEALDPYYVQQLYRLGQQQRPLGRALVGGTTPCNGLYTRLQTDPGLQTVKLGGLAEPPLPIFCNYNGTLLLKKSSGVAGSAAALLRNAPVNETQGDLLNVQRSDADYASRLLTPAYWPLFHQLLVNVVKDGNIVRQLSFVTKNATPDSWFAASRSPYLPFDSWPKTDDFKTQLGHFFDLDHAASGRQFYLGNAGGSCAEQRSWLMVTGANDACAPSQPFTVLLSPDEPAVPASQMQEADALMIYGY